MFRSLLLALAMVSAGVLSGPLQAQAAPAAATAQQTPIQVVQTIADQLA